MGLAQRMFHEGIFTAMTPPLWSLTQPSLRFGESMASSDSAGRENRDETACWKPSDSDFKPTCLTNGADRFSLGIQRH